jgi:hypothetical protein
MVYFGLRNTNTKTRKNVVKKPVKEDKKGFYPGMHINEFFKRKQSLKTLKRLNQIRRNNQSIDIRPRPQPRHRTQIIERAFERINNNNNQSIKKSKSKSKSNNSEKTLYYNEMGNPTVKKAASNDSIITQI